MHRRGVRSGGRLVQGWGGWVTAPPLGDTGSAKTVYQAGSAAAGPRPGSEAAAGSAPAFFRTPPGPAEPARLVTPFPGWVRTWDRGEGFSGTGAGGTGAGGRTSGEGRADGSPGVRGPRGPAPRPARLTQIAEAPGEEPLAAPGSRLLPPALLSPGRGKLNPAEERPAAGRPGVRSPSTLRVPWPVTATDRFQVLPSP